MVADVEVGAFLSGGLDSSAVVAFARGQARNGRLACFTIETSHSAAEEGFVDDLPYARKVAAQLGRGPAHDPRRPGDRRPLQKMIWHLDEPQADLAPLNALLICELARAHGIKVLLSGAGGDDIFSGYRRHYALMQERWWAWLPAPARRAIASGARSLPAGGSLARRVRKALGDAGLDGDERLISYFNWLQPAEGAAPPVALLPRPRSQTSIRRSRCGQAWRQSPPSASRSTACCFWRPSIFCATTT